MFRLSRILEAELASTFQARLYFLSFPLKIPGDKGHDLKFFTCDLILSSVIRIIIYHVF